MRTLTAAQQAVIMARRGWGSWARVRVQDSGGTYRDLTNLLGHDFLQGVTLDSQTDAPVDSATVYVRREINGWKLAPLVTDSPLNLLTGSYSPLLKEGRVFVVETAVLPDGSTPKSADYMEVFRGRIEQVDAGGDELVFSGFDLSYKLMATFIEVERAHTSQSLQSHITKILTDNSMVAEFPLYTPVSPSVTFGAYVQKTEPIYSALLNLARQIGWEVRYKWDSGTSAFRLTLWSPNRSASSPVATLSATEYKVLSTVRSTMEDVRNVIEVVYSDTADLDTTGKPKRKTHVEVDSASVTAYGRRWMRAAEAASSNINTATEAERMAEAALSDLATPTLEISAELDYRPDLELGDYIRFAGNGWHFTADQDVGVVHITHDFRGRQVRTKVLARGKPSTSRRQWLELDVRPGIAPPPPFTGPGAPVNVAVAAIVNGVRVTWAPPSTGPSSPAAAAYEVHVSTSSGFTPGAGTLKGTVDGQSFELADLLPGTTYYAKVIPRDAKGNAGTTSSQATITSSYLTPGSAQPFAEFYSRVLNYNFEVNTVSGAPPDTWSARYGTWDTDMSLSTDAYSGGRSVELLGGLTGGLPRSSLQSGLFVVRNGDRYKLDVFYKGNATAGSPLIGVLIYDSSFSLLGTAFSFSLSHSTSWTRASQSGTISNSSAKYGRVFLQGPAGAGADAKFDSIIVDSFEAGSIFAAYNRSTNQSISNATFTVVDFSSQVEDVSGTVTTGASWKFTAPIAGLYHFQASTTFLSTPAGCDLVGAWFVNGSVANYTSRYSASGGAGYAALPGTVTRRLLAGDYVDYRVYQASGGSLNIEGGTQITWVAITRVGP